ncbi:pentatricopeptide repeat-containing protein At2g13600-like [Apium graveolens]|uniref:pentatricopeptide repeat-containing protein At2g13600-like n=1 Tax=Apium graveolens TaxID=4045 RepID=UPI003D7936A5
MILKLSLSWRHLSNPRRFICTLQQTAVISDNHPVANHNHSYIDISQKYYELMKYCYSIPLARKLHAQLINLGIISSTFLQNHLIYMYSNCGLIDDAIRVFRCMEFSNVFSHNTLINGLGDSGRVKDARKVFDEMPQRDVVSWNSIMSGYFRNGRADDTLKIFAEMITSGSCVPDQFCFSCVMKACASLGYVKLASQLHGLVEKFYLGRDNSVDSSIIDMYIKCGDLGSAEKVFLRIEDPNFFCWNSMIYGYSKLYGVQRAMNLFNQMPRRDSVSWSTMISILSQNKNSLETLFMFYEMCAQGFRSNSMTYASVLSACANICDADWGAHLHARIVRMEHSIDLYVGCGLIDMYGKCGYLRAARQVFDNLTENNVVAWTSLIGGLAQSGHEEEALVLFKQMREVPVSSDKFTLATVIGACSTIEDISLGRQLHGFAAKTGADVCVTVGNALVTMYAKCGDVGSANYAFDTMPVKDIISWTAMVSAFSQIGKVEKAREYFNEMPDRNVITWNSMLATYIQHGYFEEGLNLYNLMRQKGVKPDWITLASAISACAHSAVLKLGNQIIAVAEKSGFGIDVAVKNSSLSMYSRCGQIKEARKVFESMIVKDLISWNSMMTGYAQSGQGREVIDVFESMLKMGIAPDHISYVSVLSGCSHSGFLPEGKHYFNTMTKDHGIFPTLEHFACMVDLLGRAGLLEEARNIINDMPLEPNAFIWGALLGACRIHGNTELAEIALKKLMELDAEDSGSYILLSNIYSDAGKLKGVLDVRKLMREKGIKKNPGCSWIEVDNRVHVFTVDDISHPQIKEIYVKLEEIIKKIKETGKYTNEIGHTRPMSYHSEKIAVAYGLLTLPPWMPIRVMKNLRICRDCHLVMKLTSSVMSRELIVRDANRFHHFKDGACSCKDYW